MPFIIILIGIFLLIAGVRGKEKEVSELLSKDFGGTDSFLLWIVALLFIWAIGIVKPLEPVSKAFMVLVILVLFLTKGRGFFDQFTKQIKEATQNV